MRASFVVLALLVVTAPARAEPPRPKPAGPQPAPVARPLGAAELASLTNALAGRSVRAAVHSGERVATGLTLRVRYVGITEEEGLRRAIRGDVIPAMRAAFVGDPTSQDISLVFLACYRDKLGDVGLRPFETVRMDRPTFAKIHFENLTEEEALALFRREPASYVFDGLILWWKGSCGTDDSPDAPPVLAPLPPPAPAAAPAASTAVADALRWLGAHQSPDGGWECQGFGQWVDGAPASGPVPEGAGKAQYDVGVTGLALLAFLGAASRDRGASPLSSTVERGLLRLKAVQDAEGCYGERLTSHYVYNHAVATLAMLEAYDRKPNDILRRSVQQALAFSEAAQNPGFAWRYGVKPGDNDTSVTGWMAQGFLRAREINARETAAGRPAPFAFSPRVLEGVRAWLGKVTNDEGRAGYVTRGTGPARPTDLLDKFPSERSESMTAIVLLLRGLLGDTPDASAPMRRGIALCLALPPVWSPGDGRIDMYYWHHATAALKRSGGPAWAEWKSRMRSVAESSQRTDTGYGAYKGSWDNVDPWGPDGGRVYSTAMMALCLEAASE